MEGKKICFVCPWMNKDGGLQRVVTNLANLFAEHNFVTVCVLSKYEDPPYYTLHDSISVSHLTEAADSNRHGAARVFGKLFEFAPCPFPDIQRNIYYSKQRVEILYRYLEKENFDYVIASCGDLSLLLTFMKEKEIGAVLIGWQHNSFDVYFKDKGKYCYGREKLAQVQYCNLDALICLTQKDARRYKTELGIDAKCIYNPLSFSSNERADLSQKNIIFVGRLTWEQKGLDFLCKIIDAFFEDPKSNGWIFTIVGGGDDELKLKKCFFGKKYETRIVFTGQTRNVIENYLKASICINTSKWEGFGLVITEAMECGLPVVAFNTDGPSEIIKDTENGFVIPCYDISVFVNKLLLLAQNTEMRHRMGAEALKTAENYLPKKIFSQWEEMMQGL